MRYWISMLVLSRSAKAGLIGTEARDGVAAATAGPIGVADKEAYKFKKIEYQFFYFFLVFNYKQGGC